ncbi:MAG: O-antigen ligase family protein [bacterium]
MNPFSKVLSITFSQESFYSWVLTVLLSILTLVHLFFPFTLWFFIIVMILSAWIIFYHPVSGLTASILTTMVWERWFTLSPIVLFNTSYKLYPLDIILFLVVVSLILHAVFHPLRHSYRLSSLDKSVLVWIAIVSLVAVVSNNSFVTVISAWKNYVFYAIIYFLAVWLFHDSKRLQTFSSQFITTSVFLLVFLVIGILLGRGLWSEYTPLSTSGTRLLASTHAYYISLAGFLLLVQALFKRYLISAVTSWSVLACQTIGLAVSLFRNLWLGVAVAFSQLFLSASTFVRQRLTVIFLKGFGLLAVLAVIATILFQAYPDASVWHSEQLSSMGERLSTFTQPTVIPDDSTAWRLSAWQGALSNWLESPVWGKGLGAVVRFKYNEKDQEIVSAGLHNDWLAFLTQMGVLGLGAILAVLFFAYRASRNVIRNPLLHSTQVFPLLLGWTGILTIFVVAAFFGTYFDTNLLSIFFWLSLGMIRSLTSNLHA